MRVVAHLNLPSLFAMLHAPYKSPIATAAENTDTTSQPLWTFLLAALAIDVNDTGVLERAAVAPPSVGAVGADSAPPPSSGAGETTAPADDSFQFYQVRHEFWKTKFMANNKMYYEKQYALCVLPGAARVLVQRCVT
jgi:hypothetical protein